MDQKSVASRQQTLKKSMEKKQGIRCSRARQERDQTKGHSRPNCKHQCAHFQSLNGHLVYVRTSHDCLRCGTWFARLAHSRRSCSAFAGWDSLANHSLGLIALGFARAMNGLGNRWLAGCLNGKSVCCVRFRADGDQTSLRAVPALQSAASVTAVFSSVLYSQTSGQECVLQRATFATVRYMRRRW